MPQITNPNHFFPGIYKFPFAFIGNANDVGICDVELHIAEGLSANTEYLVTVIIRSSEKSTPPLEHFIEEVCTKIRANFFDRLLNEILSSNIMVDEKRIRWIEILPYAQGQSTIKEVTMDWNNNSKSYRSAKWTLINLTFD